MMLMVNAFGSGGFCHLELDKQAQIVKVNSICIRNNEGGRDGYRES